MEDIIELGGNIELNGFSNLDGATMIILKKIVGNYVKSLNERLPNFEKLSLTLNHNERYKLNAEVVNKGDTIYAEIQDKNLFFALDKVLKKIEANI